MLDNYLKWCSFFFAFASSYYCVAMEDKAREQTVTSISEFEQRYTEHSPEKKEVSSHPCLTSKDELVGRIAAQAEVYLRVVPDEMLANRDLEQLANFVSKIPLVDETSEEYSSSHRAYWCHKYEGEEYNCPTRRWIEENNDAVMEIKNTVRWNAPGVSSNKVCVAELPAGLCDVNLVKVILEHWYDLFPSSVDIRRGAAMLSFSSSEDAQRLVDKPFNYRGIFYSTSFASQYENREILLIAGLPDALLNSFGVVAAALTKDTGRCLVEPVYFERFGPYLAAVIGIEESSTATLEERLAAITEATKSVIEVDEERYKVFSLGSF